jgi:predicted nucleic acid-binding protein
MTCTAGIAEQWGWTTSLRFLDTNIFLYSISRAGRGRKRNRAIKLIERGGNAPSVQVLQEFYVQATRPTRSDAIQHDVAAGLIRTWLRFKMQEISVTIVEGLDTCRTLRVHGYGSPPPLDTGAKALIVAKDIRASARLPAGFCTDQDVA